MQNSDKQTLKKWHIPNNYFDSAFLGTKFSEAVTYAKFKGSLKNETLWHWGNCPNSAEAPCFTQQGPLKIHPSSTGWLCSPLALNESDSWYLHFTVKKFRPPDLSTNLRTAFTGAETGSNIFCKQSWLPAPKYLWVLRYFLLLELLCTTD